MRNDITDSLITYQQTENQKPSNASKYTLFPSILLSTKLKIISQTPPYFSTLNKGIICLPILHCNFTQENMSQ